MITKEQLHQLMPLCEHPDLWVEPLNDAAREFDISLPWDISAWLANIAVESSQLNDLQENLNYRADRLPVVWPSHFKTTEEAQPYAHDPKKLANKVYANKYGNGDEASGDGFKFSGKGPCQLTFKSAYEACHDDTGIDCVNHPELLLRPAIGSRVAGWFWHWKNCHIEAEHNNFKGVIKRWAGAYIAVPQRELFFNRALTIFS